MITVILHLAVLCFSNRCYPALVGTRTPVGTYTVTRELTRRAGYGGDILVYKDMPTEVFAIHRVWLLKPVQRRAQRLQSPDPRVRRYVTGGCINIMPDVYQKLVASGDHTLKIEP